MFVSHNHRRIANVRLAIQSGLPGLSSLSLGLTISKPLKACGLP